MILYYILMLSLALQRQRFFSYHLFGFTVEKYLGLLCLLYALFYLLLRKSPLRLWASWQVRAFSCFFVLAEVSWLSMSLQKFHDSMLVVYLSESAFLVSTLILVDSLKRLRWALLAALAGVAWASLYSLREWQKMVPIYGFGYRPKWNPAGDPNYLAASAVLCLPVAYYLLTRSKRRFERISILACTLPIVGALLVGASRGGFLALIVAGLVVLLQARGKRTKLILLGAALAAVFLLSPVSPLRRLLHPDFAGVNAEDYRLELWGAGLRMIEDHPFAGIGLGNFKAEVPAYLLPGQRIDFIAHNTYIEVAAETGLPGLLLFLWILAATFRSLARTRRRARENDSALVYAATSGLTAGLAGYSVAMIFLSTEFMKFFWFGIFLAAALEPLAGAKQSEQTAQETVPPEAEPVLATDTESLLPADWALSRLPDWWSKKWQV